MAEYRPVLKKGEIYVGQYQHDGQTVHVVLLPHADQEFQWKGAMGWAEQKKASLPNIEECRMLRETFYDEFYEAIYWTCESLAQVPGAGLMAWAFCFDRLGEMPEPAHHKRYARLVRREIEK